MQSHTYGTEEYLKRYGEYDIEYNLSILITLPIIFISFFSIISYNEEDKKISLGLFIIMLLVFIGQISPWLEYCCYKYDEIKIKYLFSTDVIKIPENVSIIISYAQPRDARYGGYGRVLKNKMAISFIDDQNIESIIKTLRKGYIAPPERMQCRYSDKSLENVFKYKFLYSFVCDEKYLNEIVKNRRGLLIIPQIFMNDIKIDKTTMTICVDKAFIV